MRRYRWLGHPVTLAESGVVALAAGAVIAIQDLASIP